MNFLEILKFEIEYRLRRPSTWLFLLVMIGLALFMTHGLLIGEAERAGDLHANGPVGMAVGNIVVGMMGMVISAALFSGAALRDLETRMHPLFATSPITKTDYLGGRFFGALIVNAALLTVVPFALMVLTHPAFIAPELLGPFRPIAYLQPYAMFLLPNLFSTGAILFAVAVLTRRSLPVFATGVFLFFGSLLVEEVVAEQMKLGTLATLLEPFGFVGLSEQWEFWTAHEKNTKLTTFAGPLLWNRFLWFGIGVLVLAFTRARFRIESERRTKRRTIEEREDAAPARLVAPDVRPRFGFGTRVQQALAIAGQSFRELALSRDFFVISILMAIMVITLGAASLADNFGVPLWPLTQFIAPFLGSFLPAAAIALLTTFYAGELIWRERDARLDDITDANPVPGWALFAGKFGALALMLVALQTVLLLSGLVLQVAGGHFDFELGLFVKIVFGLKLSEYLLLAALAMLVHVVVDNKYFGHLLVVIFYFFTAFAGRFGVENRMLVYGRDSGWVYSDVSGFGPFLEPVLWFKLYWAGFALLFAILASLLWVRGRDRGIGKRLRLARLRFTRGAAVATIAAVLILAGAGGYLYSQIHVIGEYRTKFESDELRAQYERLYGKYENAPQPTVRGTKLHVEIYPERRAVDVRGTYVLVNETAQPIRQLHLFLNPEVQNRAVAFDREARVTIDDVKLGHRTYELARPLAPGAPLEMKWDLRY